MDRWITVLTSAVCALVIITVPVFGQETPIIPELLEGQVNVNTADTYQLTLIWGDKTLADNIVAYLGVNGPFAAIDDLLQVRGMNPERLDAMRQHLQTEGMTYLNYKAP